jgi:phosphatidylglycerophosphate synthase
VRGVQTGPTLGLLAQLVLLAALTGTVGLSGLGWTVGCACGVLVNILLARGLAATGARSLGPANRITLARAVLVGGVAALAADSIGRPIPVATLVGLAAVALVLDGIDGSVARRTSTVSPLGAGFDMEVDALLILVLSGYVAQSVGVWVLAIGLARYVLVAAGPFLPWLRGVMPTRYWRKVVAATQGVVLTVAAADVLPRWLVTATIIASLAMLTASFGSEVWWRWQHRVIARRPAVTLPAWTDA